MHLNSNIHKSLDEISETWTKDGFFLFLKTNKLFSFFLMSYCTSSINLTKKSSLVEISSEAVSGKSSSGMWKHQLKSLMEVRKVQQVS